MVSGSLLITKAAFPGKSRCADFKTVFNEVINMTAMKMVIWVARFPVVAYIWSLWLNVVLFVISLLIPKTYTTQQQIFDKWCPWPEASGLSDCIKWLDTDKAINPTLLFQFYRTYFTFSQLSSLVPFRHSSSHSGQPFSKMINSYLSGTKQECYKVSNQWT